MDYFNMKFQEIFLFRWNYLATLVTMKSILNVKTYYLFIKAKKRCKISENCNATLVTVDTIYLNNVSDQVLKFIRLTVETIRFQKSFVKWKEKEKIKKIHHENQRPCI